MSKETVYRIEQYADRFQLFNHIGMIEEQEYFVKDVRAEQISVLVDEWLDRNWFIGRSTWSAGATLRTCTICIY